MASRKYTLKKRAEAQDATRERITRAAVALHERLGPRRATISAIAEEAGVQRLTVYRHFPDEFALFAACTSHWLQHNPPPDPAAWRAADAPKDRLQRALSALYAYYARTEGMWSVSYRDVDEVPALAPAMNAFEDYLRAMQQDLLAAWPRDGRTKTRKALIAHAVRLSTWQSLVRQGGLGTADAVSACVRWIDGADDTARRTA